MQNDYHSFTKKLLNFRKDSEVLHYGKLLQYIPENNVYVYFRYNDEERVMVVINNNPEAQTLDLERFSEGLAGATAAKNVISEEQVELENELEISGKSSLILELK